MDSNGSDQSFPVTVSVVVPVFNSQATLVELCERIQGTLTGCVTDFEVILVNDGSQDQSWKGIRTAAQESPRVSGLDLMRNYGQHNALLAGIQWAQHEVIVTLDDDLQQPPEEIPKLLSKLTEGYDVVYGRPVRRSHSWTRNLSSWVLKRVLGVVLGTEMANHSSSFRAFPSALAQGFRDFRGAHLAIDVLLSWSAATVTHVPVEHAPRREGRSGYTLKKLILLAYDQLTGYSTLPLRVASGVGLVASAIGFLMFLYHVIRRLFQTEYVPGFAFLASEIALFAGLQLFAIGIIGEYLARLHFRTMGKPPYVVRERVGRGVLSPGAMEGLVSREREPSAHT